MAEMKIGRIEPCPSKSGKKYKRCHGAMEEKNDIDPNIPLQSIIERGVKAGNIKQCIHPDKSNCSGKIVKAHSIQNNRILDKIGRNGEVYTYRMNLNLSGENSQLLFRGFADFTIRYYFSQLKIQTM